MLVGDSRKIQNSNSIEKCGVYPAARARAVTVFKRLRGHTGYGVAGSDQKSQSKCAVPGSEGSTRKVERSILACKSGYPVCQPVRRALSYSTSAISQPK